MSGSQARDGSQRWPAWLLIACAFVPAVVLGGVPYPSISGKTLVFRLLITAVLACMSWLAVRDRSYRAALSAKLRTLWKHPLCKALVASYALLVLSTIFAFDRFAATYSTVDRAEGLVGLTFFYAFFFLAAMVFEKRDWDRFFVCALVCGWLVFLVELFQAFDGIVRPASLMDNPIYLAGYLLFVFFAGCAVWMRGVAEGRKNMVRWGIATLVIAVVGLLITQTRGALAGFAVGCVAMLAYLCVRGKGIMVFRRIDARTVSGWLLAVMAVFGGVFVATRHAPVWQDVPGLDRIAAFTFKDSSTVSRGINAEIALKAVDPHTVGIGRTLLGWGWDNYTYLWERFYDPHLYAYDVARFDRAHDKLLDVLSMTGVLGLLAYLLVWWLLLRAILRIGREAPLEAAALLLWAVAFFVQDLTAFDTVITFLTFFVMLAYVCFRTARTGPAPVVPVAVNNARPRSVVLPAMLCAATAVFAWMFIVDTLLPHVQMMEYRTELQETWSLGNASLLSDFVFAHNTYAQGTIRNDLLNVMFEAYNAGRITSPSPFLDRGIAEMQAYLNVHPHLYDDQLVLAKAYDVQAMLYDDPTYYKTAETHYLAALALIPNRQTVIYPYAINLEKQGRMDEAVALLDGALARDPEILQTHYILAEVYALDEQHHAKDALDQFEISLNAGINMNPPFTLQAYKNFLQDFKDANDAADFRVDAVRLESLDPSLAPSMGALLQSLDATRVIPPVSDSGA